MKYLSAATAFMFYCDAKHSSDILWGSGHVRCYLFSLILKTSKTIAIYIKDSISKCSNFRAISLLSKTAKICTGLYITDFGKRKCLMDFLEIN